ncbi:ferritin-like domain-containing protein, partial [Lachnospira sp.]
MTNKYLADIAVSDIKIHNLHWNVVGPQFKAVHEFLESIYDSYSEA